ncbi:unnamed protein product [Urochloa humidicola]
MNPETKLILDTLTKRFDDFELKWGSRFDEAEEKIEARFIDSEGKFEARIIESKQKTDARLLQSEDKIGSKVAESEEKLEIRLTATEDGWERRFADMVISQDARVTALERASTAYDEWRPDIEGTVDDMRLEVGKLNKHWERTVLDHNKLPLLQNSMQPISPVLPQPSPTSASAAGRPSAAGDADRPIGHCFVKSNREGEYGSVTTMLHPPDKRTFPGSNSFHMIPNSVHMPSDKDRYHASGKLPKLPFPKFDGENPKLWISRCEDYFDLFDLEPNRWVKIATMYFSDAAGRWLQSMEKRVKSSSWPEFCKLVLDRFGREQHEILVWQLLHIKQSGAVKEYVERFASLVDQLAAYETHADPLYYTMKFIDGLREDYRSYVLLQRPPDLDIAYVLAHLQEEVVASGTSKDFKKHDYNSYSKPQFKSALPLPSPPTKQVKASSYTDDRQTSDIARAHPGISSEEKWRALKAMRRAKGLCQYCAEKWSRDHKCADKVQLHAVQELMEVFQLEDDTMSVLSASRLPEEQLFLTLSVAAVSGIPYPKTLCLEGTIQDQQIRILVDSGSSHSFLSASLSSTMVDVSEVPDLVTVQVANGQRLICSQQLLQAKWSVGGYVFQSNLKILPLSSYDLILGMDWLEAHSPMKVHWQQKWLAIPYETTTAVLYGSRPDVLEGTTVQVCNVEVSIVADKVEVSIPPEVQDLIQEFAQLFEVPHELPPPRACDHAIPLMEGAAPIQNRPYRYAPALKDEIEKQIKEMLQNGIIQRSSSPFSSSVLLVKKKDGSWRFCVDYRHLNAITIKCKYPVPIIDEFLDELGKASWFSCLDLRAGFHQIRLKPGEEYKTAFQTHCGQFEFRVMAFGLTGAPGTFQEAMNTTLAPYLRKFVLVFFDDILIYSTSYEEHLMHLRMVFELLSQDHWKVKLSKCSFA